MVIPLGKLPSGLRAFAEALPAGALSDLLHAAFRSSAAGVPVRAWVVLGAWAIGAPVLAARLFRWE
jgi:ABC-2 type transport system permease protein